MVREVEEINKIDLRKITGDFLAFCASVFSFLFLILFHFECPDMIYLPFVLYLVRGLHAYQMQSRLQDVVDCLRERQTEIFNVRIVRFQYLTCMIKTVE